MIAQMRMIVNSANENLSHLRAPATVVVATNKRRPPHQHGTGGQKETPTAHDQAIQPLCRSRRTDPSVLSDASRCLVGMIIAQTRIVIKCILCAIVSIVSDWFSQNRFLDVLRLSR